MDGYPNIDRIGIELEGGWDYSNLPRERKSDGSVSLPGFGGFRGEVVSQPYSRLGNMMNFIERTYPIRWNDSCGLHIHMSFPKLWQYGEIMEIRYRDFIKSAWMDFAGTIENPEKNIFLDRIAGGNTYCKDVFRPTDFYYATDRYHQINFSAYQRHRTIEFRVAPMMKMEDCKKYVTMMVEKTNAYLCTISENSNPKLELEFEGPETGDIIWREI